MTSSRKANLGAMTALLALGLLAAPAAASAATPTTIAFEPATATFSFGAPWLLEIDVGTEEWLVLEPSSGTVDVFLEGQAEPFAEDLPMQYGGTAFLSQPASQPLLGAGDHRLTAFFEPASGSGFAPSQTASPAILTITALGLAATVQVSADPSVSAIPEISASVSGSYLESAGGAPAGVWEFAVSDPVGVVFERTVIQPHGATEPIIVMIDGGLEPGTQYSLSSTFTVVEELASGIVVTDAGMVGFRSPDGSFVEGLVAPVELPIWLAVLLGAVIAGLIAAIIVLWRKSTRSGGAAVTGDPWPSSEPAPQVLLSTTPAEPETELLPRASSSWSLSDEER